MSKLLKPDWALEGHEIEALCIETGDNWGGEPYYDYDIVPHILANLRREVIAELRDLGAWLYYKAATGSQYVKFRDPAIGSLRIGDHPGLDYTYRWNIRLDMCGFRTQVKGAVTQRFYGHDRIEQFYSDIRTYAKEAPKPKSKPQPFDLNRIQISKTIRVNKP